MGRFFLEHILPWFIAPIYWLYTRTWRFHKKGSPEVIKFVESGAPCIFAHWHGDELVLVGYYSFKNAAVLSSLSKDGSIMAKTLTILGYQVFRGSSSRGGARGLIGLIRAVQNGSQASLAVDGPKGPIYEVKPGVVELARKTQKPIVPIFCNTKSAWFIPRAWNRCYVPKPFVNVDVFYCDPILPNKDESIEDVCAKIKQKLDQKFNTQLSL